MALFDVNAVEAEVQAELAAERGKDAKEKIKAKLVQIQKAEKILQTLRMEYKDLLAEIALDS